MSKPYSDADFSVQITDDRSWRLKEISDLKTAIIRADADTNLRRVLLRGLVTICYAHWEGYVRFAARKYLEHVALRKFNYKDLDRQFLRNYFLPRLAALSISKTSVLERCALVDEILNSSERRFSRVNEELVNTKANLTFDVFTDICLAASRRRHLPARLRLSIFFYSRGGMLLRTVRKHSSKSMTWTSLRTKQSP